MTNQNHTSTDSQQGNPPLSKRQRRAQGPNPSNTWQQQPRIKSAGARARAYISYAGLADEKNNDDGNNNNDDGNNKGSQAGKKKKKKNSSNDEGGGGGSKKRSSADLPLDPQLDLHSPEVKFGRLLGGTDQRSRHHAVKMLREYLRARSDISTGSGLSELDLLKLWKGLWYTLYMADKIPVQDKLSKILAELMWCISGTEEEDEYAGQVYCQMTDEGEGAGVPYEDEDGDTMEIIEMEDSGEDDDDDDDGEKETDTEHTTDEDSAEDDEDSGDEDDDERRAKDMNETHCRGAHLVSLYIATFLRTVRREWGNVDKHRVDKFYTAVRYMVGEAYKYMSKRHWNIGIVRLFNDVLYEEALSAETPGLTNGLRYHLIDICLEELARANAEAELPLTEATLLDCLEPFFGLAQRAVDKNVQRRVMDNVLSKFLNEYSFVCPAAVIDDDDDGEEDAKALIFNEVHVGTVSKFIFEIASDGDTDERFRKSLYDMHKTYVRQIRAAGRDVDLDHYSEEEEEQDDVELDDDVEIGAKCDNAKEVGEEDIPEEQDADTAPAPVETAVTGTDQMNSSTAPAQNDDADDVTSAVQKYEPTPEKKKKKKRKKKNKGGKGPNKEVEKDVPETPEKAAGEDNSNVTTPPAKSSNKKRKNKDTEAAEIESTAPAPDAKTLITPKPRKKKQMSPPSVDPRSMHSPDQVVSPASSDNDDMSASKRVSFGAMNHCKSHKASIKAMKRLNKDRWDTKSRTPDKGILRPGMKSGEKGKRPPLGPSSRKKRGKKQS